MSSAFNSSWDFLKALNPMPEIEDPDTPEEELRHYNTMQQQKVLHTPRGTRRPPFSTNPQYEDEEERLEVEGTPEEQKLWASNPLGPGLTEPSSKGAPVPPSTPPHLLGKSFAKAWDLLKAWYDVGIP